MDREIIDRVLSGTATPEEGRNVAAWLATDEGQEYLSMRFDREAYLLNEQLLKEWHMGEIPAEKMKVRLIAALKHRFKTFRFKLIAAACIPFILLLGSFFFIVQRTGVLSKSEMAEISVPHGERLQLILQDGTQVYLNSGSTLSYPKSFGLFRRAVRLRGEAFFTVAEEKQRPFVVDLGEMSVRVTGTKFNIKAYQDEGSIYVTLVEGGVDIVLGEDESHYALKRGQHAQYDRQTQRCTISSVEDIAEKTAWLTKSINFYRSPLDDILKTLERQYDVRFEISDSIALKNRFSISSSSVQVEDILKELEKVSNIKFLSVGEKRYLLIAE